MALELVPETPTISWSNKIPDANLVQVISTDFPDGQRANGEERPQFPARNVQIPHRTQVWRSRTSPGDGDTIRFVFDMGTEIQPDVFALIEANFLSPVDGGTTKVRLMGSSNLNPSTSGDRVYWDLPTYEPLVSNKMNLWYLGDTPSSNEDSGTSRRYWSILIDNDNWDYDTSLDYFEIGTIWLGNYSSFPILGSSLGSGLTSHADAGSAAFGTPYFFPYRTGHNLRLRAGPMSTTSALAMKEEFVVAKEINQVILDLYPHLNSSTRRPHSAHYGRISSFSIMHDTAQYALCDIAFSESLG